MRIKLDIALTSKEICRVCDVSKDTQKERKITHIVTDSREAHPGDLFLSLAGERSDAQMYNQDAGARGAVVLSRFYTPGGWLIANTEDSLLRLASYYRDRLPHLRYVVAVTGSVGKTTTKEFIRATLSAKYRVYATPGNQNNLLGLPLSVLSAPGDTEILVLEMGMNAPGEIARMSLAVRPHIGVITNIGTAHIGLLGNRLAILDAKREITRGMRLGAPVLVPAQEPMLTCIPGAIRVGTDGTAEADFALQTKKEDANGIQATLFPVALPPYTAHICLPGDAGRWALAFCGALAECLGLSGAEVNKGLLAVPYTQLHQTLRRIGRRQILYDLYNASPEATESALRTLQLFEGGRAALLGDMLELGTHTQQLHHRIGKAAANAGIGYLFLFGVYAPFIAQGAREGGMPPERIFCNSDLTSPQKSAEQIQNNLPDGFTLLCKASRGVRLERVVECLDNEIKKPKED